MIVFLYITNKQRLIVLGVKYCVFIIDYSMPYLKYNLRTERTEKRLSPFFVHCDLMIYTSKYIFLDYSAVRALCVSIDAVVLGIMHLCTAWA